PVRTGDLSFTDQYDQLQSATVSEQPDVWRHLPGRGQSAPDPVRSAVSVLAADARSLPSSTEEGRHESPGFKSRRRTQRDALGAILSTPPRISNAADKRRVNASRYRYGQGIDWCSSRAS